jgi:tRNA modification GTPase
VRLSGDDAWRIASEVFSPWPSPVEPRRAVYGGYSDGDDGLVLPFSAGHSYTGEESVELSMHGSRASIQFVVDACLAAGARMAEPGEFTQRAFLNGRIDLTQAEAVRDLIEAQTEVQLRQAARNRDGALRREIEEVREGVLAMLAAVEASVDFSEEVGDFDREIAETVLEELRVRLACLHEGAKMSRIVREGYRIAIVGPPNSGKSSLFNRLLGANRAIVTPVPGTTRDYIEETADFHGVAVVLIDTAGLRETEDVVEAIGIELARRAAQEADEVLFVFDASVGWTTAVQWALDSLGRRPSEILANKVDLGVAGALILPSSEIAMPCSAKTGLNLDRFIEDARREVLLHAPPVAVNERQAAILDQAIATLQDLRKALNQAPDDLLSVLLRDLANQLGRITGQTAEPDMIERIFHDFCVGK